MKKISNSNIIQPMLSNSHDNKDDRKKKQAIEHSLSLIQSSLDCLQILENEESAMDEETAVASLNKVGKVKENRAAKYRCSNEMIRELIKDHERLIGQLSSSLNKCYIRFRDGRISNLTRNVIEEHKSIAWTLKRFLVS